MIYIYDILLNFTDRNRILEFYEWHNKDVIDHIKKIPLYRISSENIEGIIKNKIKVTNDFLSKIKDKTLIYKSKNSISYACLFSDTNKVVAVEFDSSGNSIGKSFLMLDEEEEVLDDSIDLDIYKLEFQTVKKNQVNYFLTREELFKQNYLFLEIRNLYDRRLFDKFNYLYEEIFGKDSLDITDKYNKFINDISCNYGSKYNYLYDIVRLSYSNKK